MDQINYYNITINILNQNLVIIFITSAIDLSQDSRLIFCVIYSCCQKKGVLSFYQYCYHVYNRRHFIVQKLNGVKVLDFVKKRKTRYIAINV